MAEEFTVFVVDDDGGIRKSIQNLCEAERIPVETFATGDAFLEGYDPSRRGCLLLDMRLEGSSGLDLQDELARRGSRLPVVVMTAYGSVPTSVRAFKGGAMDFLQKPIAPEVLLERIQLMSRRDREIREEEERCLGIEERIASLTPRERQVMEHLLDGAISKEVAFDLGVSTRTIEGHRREVLRKMGVTSAAQLVRLVMSARK
jgi:FixJ family two-component response regulator